MCVVENDKLPSPASLRPPSSRPSLQPCLTVRQAVGRENTVTTAEVRGSRMHRAISYSDSPSRRPPQPSLPAAELLQSDGVSREGTSGKTSSTHPQTDAHRPTLLSQQMIRRCWVRVTSTTPGEGRVPRATRGSL